MASEGHKPEPDPPSRITSIITRHRWLTPVVAATAALALLVFATVVLWPGTPVRQPGGVALVGERQVGPLDPSAAPTVTAPPERDPSPESAVDDDEDEPEPPPVEPPAQPRVSITGSQATADAITITFTLDPETGGVTCEAAIAPGDRAAVVGCGDSHTFTGLAAGTTYTVTVTATSVAGSGSASAKVTTDSVGTAGVVTCVDRESNPDPEYCVENGGIGTFTNPNPETNTNVGRLMPESPITAVCRERGKSVRAGVYNDHKESDYWLRMDDGLYIPWIWVTLVGDDSKALRALPTC